MYRFFSKEYIANLNEGLLFKNNRISKEDYQNISTGIYRILDMKSDVYDKESVINIDFYRKYIDLINQGKAELILTLQDLDTVEEIDAMEASFNDGYKHMVDKVNYEAYNAAASKIDLAVTYLTSDKTTAKATMKDAYMDEVKNLLAFGVESATDSDENVKKIIKNIMKVSGSLQKDESGKFNFDIIKYMTGGCDRFNTEKTGQNYMNSLAISSLVGGNIIWGDSDQNIKTKIKNFVSEDIIGFATAIWLPSLREVQYELQNSDLTGYSSKDISLYTRSLLNRALVLNKLAADIMGNLMVLIKRLPTPLNFLLLGLPGGVANFIKEGATKLDTLKKPVLGKIPSNGPEVYLNVSISAALSEVDWSKLDDHIKDYYGCIMSSGVSKIYLFERVNNVCQSLFIKGGSILKGINEIFNQLKQFKNPIKDMQFDATRKREIEEYSEDVSIEGIDVICCSIEEYMNTYRKEKVNSFILYKNSKEIEELQIKISEEFKKSEMLRFELKVKENRMLWFRKEADYILKMDYLTKTSEEREKSKKELISVDIWRESDKQSSDENLSYTEWVLQDLQGMSIESNEEEKEIVNLRKIFFNDYIISSFEKGLEKSKGMNSNFFGLFIYDVFSYRNQIEDKRYKLYPIKIIDSETIYRDKEGEGDTKIPYEAIFRFEGNKHYYENDLVGQFYYENGIQNRIEYIKLIKEKLVSRAGQFTSSTIIKDAELIKISADEKNIKLLVGSFENGGDLYKSDDLDIEISNIENPIYDRYGIGILKYEEDLLSLDLKYKSGFAKYKQHFTCENEKYHIYYNKRKNYVEIYKDRFLWKDTLLAVIKNFKNGDFGIWIPEVKLLLREGDSVYASKDVNAEIVQEDSSPDTSDKNSNIDKYEVKDMKEVKNYFIKDGELFERRNGEIIKIDLQKAKRDNHWLNNRILDDKLVLFPNEKLALNPSVLGSLNGYRAYEHEIHVYKSWGQKLDHLLNSNTDGKSKLALDGNRIGNNIEEKFEGYFDNFGNEFNLDEERNILQIIYGKQMNRRKVDILGFREGDYGIWLEEEAPYYYENEKVFERSCGKSATLDEIEELNYSENQFIFNETRVLDNFLWIHKDEIILLDEEAKKEHEEKIKEKEEAKETQATSTVNPVKKSKKNPDENEETETQSAMEIAPLNISVSTAGKGKKAFVASGAKLKCSFGKKEGSLTATIAANISIGGKIQATIMDCAPMTNIAPFGKCKCMSYPPTAANKGRLKPMPCVPGTGAPWTGGSTVVNALGNPALLEDSKLICMYGGQIQITDVAQKIAKGK